MPNLAEIPTRAILITTDGNVAKIELALGSAAETRQFLCDQLGDAPDVVTFSLTSRFRIWLDSEGYNRQPANMPATWLARSFGLVATLYGPALIAGVDGDELIGLTNDQAAALVKRITDAAQTQR